MNQKKFLLNLSQRNPDAVIVTSLGYLSRDMETIQHKNKVLVKGAMGCAMGVGLGYALGSKKKVIVVIGDGSFLMKMGSLSTFLKYRLDNFSITVVNNNIHASCGGQETSFGFVESYVPLPIVEL